MIKSVFIKYILAFLVIITISFTILASIISSTIMQHSIEAKKISIATAAKIAGQNIEIRFGGSSFDSFSEFVGAYKNKLMWDLSTYIELTENSLILVADLDGNILVYYPLPEDYLKKDTISKEIMYDVLNQNETEWFQTLDGVFSARHIISPQLLHSKTDEMCGVLFFCSESVMENTFVNSIINAIILSCLWILVAAMVIVYFITEKIVSPVRAMSRAAKSFEQGRFDVRVPVKGSRDEIGELASAFNRMAASLAVNDETQRSFLSNVAHDLRTPMTTIGGFVDGILDGTVPPEKQEHYLKIVSKDIKRLARLVSRLFEVTKLQAGEIKINKISFDICEMTRLAIISLEQQLDAKKLELEFNFEDERTYVFADSDFIHQVLYNILENAIKFTPEKGFIKINIESGGKDKERERDKKIRVSVYNTGTGIPSEDIPFIFDRLFKSDRSRGLDTSGMGLGLFIVKTLMDKHEEEIWVESDYGKYCEFTFTLQKINETTVRNKL